MRNEEKKNDHYQQGERERKGETEREISFFAGSDHSDFFFPIQSSRLMTAEMNKITYCRILSPQR